MMSPGAPVEMGGRTGFVTTIDHVEERGDDPAILWWRIDWEDGTSTVCPESEHLIDVEEREWELSPLVPEDQQCVATDSNGISCWLAKGHRSRNHRNAAARWI